MKNIFKLLAVTALAGLAAASCTKDLNGTAEGNEATVSFSVTSPLIGTKAIADGNTVDKVACYIYDADGNHIKALDKVENMNGGKATFSATLVTGKTYRFLFWAYKDGVKGYTVDADKKTLTVDYTDALANDETRDAFYNYVESYKVTGDKTEEIKLKRPFAQINFGVTEAEWNAFKTAGGTIDKTGIKVSGAANVLNFADASVTGSADVVFAANDIPAESEKLSVNGTDYRYLATTYVLAGKSQSSIHNITLTKYGLPDADIVVPNAPLQANWRTNIYGNLLTSTQNFNITVEPGFDGTNNEDLKNISTTSALQALFVNGGSATLVEDIEISEPLVLAAGKNAVLNLNGKKITNKGTDAAIRVSGDLEINGEGSVYGGTGGDNVAVWAAQGGKVTINGGEYSVGKDANGSANSCVYAYDGDIVINGGTFSSEQPWNGKYYVLNKNNGTPQSTITVTGGTFINYDPSTGDDNLGGNFVASGYQSTKVADNPTTYVVTKEGVTPVTTVAELQKVLNEAAEAGAGNSTIWINNDMSLGEGKSWTSVNVDGYNGAGVITIYGNGHTISGLDAPLFKGGFGGKSGIVIKELTLDKSQINFENGSEYGKTGFGAFIGNVDSMPKIELENCHLTNSEIKSVDDARVGGLIGYTTGYNVNNDGPVDTYVTIKNCSVEKCTITAKASVGGIIGHAGANPSTFHTIEGNTVTGCTLHSTDSGDWRVGVVVGTANVGEVTISGTDASENTLTQDGKNAPEGQSNLYGRFVPGTTGKLTIYGK